MKAKTTLVQRETKTVTGLVAPEDVVGALCGAKRAPGATNGHSYQSTLT